MKCFLCNFTSENTDIFTSLEMKNEKSKILNRRFLVCPKCACNIIEKAIKADPICSMCDKEETK